MRGGYSTAGQAAPRAQFGIASSGSSFRRRSGEANPLIGQRVRHPTYGLGTIIGVDGDEDERKLTVRFSDHGTKKLVERFANLSWA